MKPYLIIIIALSLIIILSLFQVKHYVQDLNNALISTQKTIEKTYNDIHILQAEWSYLTNPKRLEKLAKKYLITYKFILASQIHKNINAVENKGSVLAQGKQRRRIS